MRTRVIAMLLSGVRGGPWIRPRLIKRREGGRLKRWARLQNRLGRDFWRQLTHKKRRSIPPEASGRWRAVRPNNPVITSRCLEDFDLPMESCGPVADFRGPSSTWNRGKAKHLGNSHKGGRAESAVHLLKTSGWNPQAIPIASLGDSSLVRRRHGSTHALWLRRAKPNDAVGAA